MTLDFGMIAFLVTMCIGGIIVGIVLGKRFTKVVDNQQTVKQQVAEQPAASFLETTLCRPNPAYIPPTPPPIVPPPTPTPPSTLAEKTKKILEAQKLEVKIDFENSLVSSMSRGSYSFSTSCKSYSVLPKELTLSVLKLVVLDFEKANPSLKIDATLKYSGPNAKYYVVVNIIVK